MAKKSFLLVSLKENKAKKLAEVISNKTCRKILDFMAEKKDTTESEISKALNIPISTVHYNMKALMTAKLVKCDEYHYSSKGKEVNHYRLANQYVIIAPEGEKAMIREKLKSIIPTALIMGFAAGVIKMFSGFGVRTMSAKSAVLESGAADYATRAAPAMEAVEEEAVQTVATGASDAVAEAAPMVAEGANEVVVKTLDSAPQAVQPVVERAPDVITVVKSNAPEIALWFFIGAVVGVAVYLFVEWVVKRIRNR
jgi:DNA-binding transcriptional ArsR family regulator